MRKFVAAVLLVVIACPALGANTKAADFTLESASGEEVSLSERVRERPVVLFFWATWCPYCKALMPHLQSIVLEYGDDVEILALHFRDDNDPVAFIENAGYDFTVLPEADLIAAEYEVWGTPGLMLVDTNRRIRFNLYTLPQQVVPGYEDMKHSKRASYRAPYWAAELRKAIDSVLPGCREIED
jgi:thiol-disulfide isomerase/thioredoxin